MTTLKKYNLEGKEIGSCALDERVSTEETALQLVKDYIVAMRANARQWSANTKTRGEVKHTTKKVRPQKGSGRARQGMNCTPQYRGGGIVFGPKPKFNQHVRMNQKERQAAIRYLLGQHVKGESMTVLESTQLDQPKTKMIANFLKNTNMNGRILFLGEESQSEVEGVKSKVSTKTTKHQSFQRSVRNIPKVEFKLLPHVNGYDLMLADHVVLTEQAIEQMMDWLWGDKK